MPERRYNFCPFCGKRLPKVYKREPNFCFFCGKKLKQNELKLIRKVQCTICYEIVDPNMHMTIICSFCGSNYHSTCVASWLHKYNACPMCQNIFLYPKKFLEKK